MGHLTSSHEWKALALKEPRGDQPATFGSCAETRGVFWRRRLLKLTSNSRRLQQHLKFLCRPIRKRSHHLQMILTFPGNTLSSSFTSVSEMAQRHFCEIWSGRSNKKKIVFMGKTCFVNPQIGGCFPMQKFNLMSDTARLSYATKPDGINYWQKSSWLVLFTTLFAFPNIDVLHI